MKSSIYSGCKISSDEVLTPILKYSNGNCKITLIGVLHLGNKEYYNKIQKELDKHEEGFFEGGEPPESERENPLEVFGEDVYKIVAELAGLELQNLDYRSLVNVDVGFEEVEEAFDFVSKEQSEEIVSELREQYMLNPKETAKELREELIHSLVKDNSPANLILLNRDKQLYGSILEKINSNTEDFVVIYGAHHLEGIEALIKTKGFRKTSERWLTAFNI